MERRLVILRHAHAEPAQTGMIDRERPLSARGRQEAQAVRQWLDHQGFQFDRILCSPALRTQQTAVVAAHAAPGVAIAYEEGIYAATPGALLSLVDQDLPSKTLLVGHNPGLEQLIALLTEGRSDVVHGLPTAGVAVLRFGPGSAIEPGQAELQAFWSPAWANA